MASQEGYAFPEFLADTQWLAEHLGDPSIRIVDTDVAAAYHRGHIPGAVLVPDNYEKDPSTDRVHILPPQKFAEMMESLGIGDDTVVVTYDNSQSLYAGRLWWALQYYGHRDVKVLNGGWRKWITEGRAISIDQPEAGQAGPFTCRQEASLMATTDQLKELYDKPDVVVWDVRSRGEYTGDSPRHNKRPGHIPGARNLEWLEMIDAKTHIFKPAEEMRQILRSKGITPEKQIIAH